MYVMHARQVHMISRGWDPGWLARWHLGSSIIAVGSHKQITMSANPKSRVTPYLASVVNHEAGKKTVKHIELGKDGQRHCGATGREQRKNFWALCTSIVHFGVLKVVSVLRLTNRVPFCMALGVHRELAWGTRVPI